MAPMKIKEIMTADVEVVDSGASLYECAYIMRCAGVDSLPVVAGDAVVGVITDRDIVVRALAEGLDYAETKVRTVMTRDVVTCPEDMELPAARRLMAERGVRSLVVVDGEGQLAGTADADAVSAPSIAGA